MFWVWFWASVALRRKVVEVVEEVALILCYDTFSTWHMSFEYRRAIGWSGPALLMQPSSCSPAPEGPPRATSDLTESAVPHLPVVQHYHRMYIRYSHCDPDHWLQTGDCWRWASFLLPFIFLSFTPPPSFSPSVMFSAVPCRQSSLTECLLCYGFIGLVCGRNLWIKVISHCSTFSQAVKLPFTFVPLGERDRERHM